MKVPEMVFMLAKQGRYYYDGTALQIDAIRDTIRRDEGVHKVSTKTIRGILSAQAEWTKQGKSLPSMRNATGSDMASHQQRTSQSYGPQIQDKRTWEGTDSVIPKVGSGEENTKEVPAIREGKSCYCQTQKDASTEGNIKPICGVREGEGQSPQISTDREREGVTEQGCSQTSDANRRPINIDGGRMEDYLLTPQEPLRLLQNEEALDN